MSTRTGLALTFAEDIREPGFACARLNGSAWAAGVNPQATGGLIGAALALTAGEAGALLWTSDRPCGSDQVLVEAAEEIEGYLVSMLRCASGMAAAWRADRAAACAAAADARAAMASAANPQARAAAENALGAASAVIADCDAALEIIDGAGQRLAHALDCLRRVPVDLDSTYETPYLYVREGGELPYGGDFLTEEARAR